MVVRRTDLTALNQDLIDEYNEVERLIDKMLSRQWPSVMHHMDPYLTFGVKDTSSAVIQKVITEYTKAGWRTELIADQREGDFLQFRKPHSEINR
jgi:hypothetical protein